MQSIYKNRNKREIVRVAYRKLKQKSDDFFNLFYFEFTKWVNVLNKSILTRIKELRNKLLNRMTAALNITSEKFTSLKFMRKRLSKLNHQQRTQRTKRKEKKNASEYKEYRIFSAKLTTFYKSHRSFSREIISIIITITVEKRKLTDWISFLKKSFESTICYNYDEIDHYANNCSYSDKDVK